MADRPEQGARFEFAVLGPLEARRDGEPLALGGLRQRGLLALLLLRPGETVSTERLIAELFGDDATDTAANAVQQSISRLRRILAADGAAESLLVTQPPGYVLRVDAASVDLWRFEQLVVEARELLAAGDNARAAERLRASLAIWRGVALADLVELDFAQTEQRRLEEHRLGALMDRVDADLALGRTADLVPELEGLVAANPYQERLRGQLMLALYRSGRQAEALQAFRETRTQLRDELGLEPTPPLQQLEKSMLVHDPGLELPAQPTIGRDRVAICPFKGLASFDVADAHFFCGRERLVDELVARFAERSLVGVVGPSGIGKSSLLRAGLLRALDAGALPGSAGWTAVVIRPGVHPLAELERVPAEAGERCIVAIDQFEEVFTVCDDEGERRAFVDALVRFAREPARRHLVALALRADFYGRCAEYPELARLLSGSHVLVGPMSTDELERAITVPAERAQLEVEPGLVAALLADVGGEAGGLPLLSTSLLELWERRSDSTLRLADYRASGGVHGAVGRLADRTYDGLDADGKRLARSVMLRLTVGEADSAVRRRVPSAELSRGLPGVEPVLASLIDARLLTASDGSVEVAHEALLREWPRMREWLQEESESRRLETHVRQAAREWDDGRRDPADLYRGPRLSAVLDWQATHAADLSPLEEEFVEASRVAGERHLDEQRRANRRLRRFAVAMFALLVLALLSGGAALLQRGTARREARQALARQLGAEALSTTRIDQAMLLAREAVDLGPSPETQGTLLATLLRAPQAIATFSLPINSRPQTAVVSPDDRTLVVADNLATLRFYDLATRHLRTALSPLGYGHPPVYTPDGRRFVAWGGHAGHAELELADGRTFKPIRTFEFDPRYISGSCGISEPALGPNNTLTFAYCLTRPDGSDGRTYVDQWSLTTGKRLVSARPLPLVGANIIERVAGSRLLLVGDREVLWLDGSSLRVLARRRLPALLAPFDPKAVTADGRTLADVDLNGTVRLVNLHTGRLRTANGNQGAPVETLEFSPDGRTLVTGAADGSVLAWDVATGTISHRFVGHASRVIGAAFSRDGKTLFTCSLDGAVFVWDLAGNRSFGERFAAGHVSEFGLGPDESTVAAPLAISPDGTRFATRVDRTRVGIFDARTSQRELAFPVSTGGDIGALAWSETGSVAVSGGGGHVQLWDVRGTPRLVRPLRGLGSTTGFPEAVTDLVFSRDGSLLAAGDVNHTAPQIPWRYGTAAVWDTASGRLLWKSRSRRGWVTAVAFSPDGKTLVAGDESNVVTFYVASTGRVVRRIDVKGSIGITAVAFSSTGTLFTGNWSGLVQRWNPTTGRQIGKPMLAAEAPISSIDFGPGGSTFATAGGSDLHVKLWTTSSLQQLGTDLPGDLGWGNARFTPDGKHLVVVWGTDAGEIWPTSVSAWEEHACAVAGRNFSRDEWRRFVGGSYRVTCPGQPAVSGA